MKFGYFFLMHNTENLPYRDVIGRVEEQAKLAEDGGFDSFWSSEHHFGGEGWDILPNPILLNAHLAGVTSTIRLGIAAVILPEWHPLRAAEDIAMLDQISGGRVECAFGRGITNRELSNLNLLNPHRLDNDHSHAVFLETLDIVLAAWRDDPFTYDGTFYQFPRPGFKDSYSAWYPRNPGWRSEDDEYVGMSIQPKLLQGEALPLWIVADSDSGFATAAEKGLKPITWLRSSRALKQSLEVYRTRASEVQGRELRLGEDAALTRIVFVAETMQEARELAEPAIDLMYRDYLGGLRGRDIYAEPGEKISEEDLAKPWFDFLFDRGHLLVGTPEAVTDQIRSLQADVGLETLLTFSWLPGIPYKSVLQSLMLFCEQVIPAVNRTGS